MLDTFWSGEDYKGDVQRKIFFQHQPTMSESPVPDMTRIHNPGEGTYIKKDGDGHNSFTKTLLQTKDSLMHGDSAEDVKQTTTTTFQVSRGTPMVQPSGILTSLETSASGKRYADRPEGIDQFGGEEFERDVYVGEAMKDKTALRQYDDQLIGLD